MKSIFIFLSAGAQHGCIDHWEPVLVGLAFESSPEILGMAL